MRLSLAGRLTLLFAVGSSLLLLVLGLLLGWMLRQQLEARDREEIDGKTEIVLHLFGNARTAEQVQATAQSFADIGIGHPHLQLGLRDQARWLVEPTVEVRKLIESAGRDAQQLAPPVGTYRTGQDVWWLRRVDLSMQDGHEFRAYLGLHVSPTQALLLKFVRTMLLAGSLGVLASAVLGWFIARRGLRPISVIAREAGRITAERLSQPLRTEAAPEEVRGLVESINHMLDRLQASFRTLEEFSADIAHELRTPLNNLLLQTQVTLSRPRSADEYREALHLNLTELEQLQRMVSDMLFLARADRGMFRPTVETVDLAAEARGVAEYFEPAATDQGKLIAVHGQASATCDRSMARRAITNLLSNAVRYSPSGAQIEIALAQSSNEGATVEVTNPAPAMSQDELARLFGRFARGNSGGGHAESAGLGLSIVESIMRLHGGTALAQSGNFGVRFRLEFPATVSSSAGSG